MVGVCVTVTVLSFTGAILWIGELASNFCVQCFVALTVAAIVLACMGRFGAAALAMVFALLNAVLIAPYYVPAPKPPARYASLKALHINLSITNTETAKVIGLIRSFNPDVYACVELNDRWLRNLEALGAEYPHATTCTRHDQFGVGLFSKRPLRDAAIIQLGATGFPSISAAVEMDGRQVTILVVHPPPPVSALLREERIGQMVRLASFLVDRKGPVIVLGDFNMTPWSSIFRELLVRTQLRDARKGFGVAATWPTTAPPLLIPIDHCLMSPAMGASYFTVGPRVGSDHYPVMVEVGFLASPD